MAIIDLAMTYVGKVLADAFNGEAVYTDGGWALPGDGMGRVVVEANGSGEAWIEVAHVIALDVPNWSPRMWEIANDCAVNTPVSVVKYGDVLAARLVINACEVSPEALMRAIDVTYTLSGKLCDAIVGGLGIGTCPSVDAPAYDGGAVAMELDLGMDAGSAGDSNFTSSAPTGLAAATDVSIVAGGAGGYL